MSPVSRSRKKKSKRRGGTAPSANDMYRDIVRSYRRLLTTDDPVDVEASTSGVLGSLWMAARLESGLGEAALDGAALNLDVLDLIAFAGEQRGAEALAMLRAFAALAETAEHRAAATEAAVAVAGRGIPEPPWADALVQVTVRQCWCVDNVFGDDATVLCVFDTPSGQHALMTLLDYGDLAGWSPETFVADPEEALALLREEVEDSDGTDRLREISPATARRMVEQGIAGTDRSQDMPVEETFAGFRALALAWCRTMPEPEQPEPVDEARRAELVSEFLSSEQAGDLPDDPAVEQLVRSVVDFGCDEDRGQPLRVSENKLEILWEELELDEDELTVAVLAAWTRWAGARGGVPEELLDDLVEFVEEGGWLDGEDEALALIMEGLADVEDNEELAEAATRRLFAMPFTAADLDEELGHLDPNDPDERRMLIAAAHPEYHEVLDDPAADDVLVDGVDPRMHLAFEEIVINQLWDNDPPEVWEAAKRLMVAGLDRHEVLTRIGAALAPSIHRAMSGEPGHANERSAPGQDEYLTALRELGRD